VGAAGSSARAGTAKPRPSAPAAKPATTNRRARGMDALLPVCFPSLVEIPRP
jgi:hypothetical protein